MTAPSQPGTRSPGNDIAHFKIGEMSVSLRSDLDEVMEDFDALYGPCRLDRLDAEDAIRIEIKTVRPSRWRRHKYVIRGDGEALWSTRRANEVLPYVEWGINWRVIATRANYFQIHAATVARSGQGVLFAGKAGSGKSTLAAGLLSRGWSYLSDEFALIHPETLRLHSFPKALCIKSGSFDVVERLDLPLWRRRHYVKVLKGRVGYLSPHRLGPRAVGGPCPVRYVIFPKYAEGAAPYLYEMSRAEAAFALAELAFNRNEFGHRAMSILSKLVRGATCFGLDAGPIDETCDLVESLLSDAPSRADRLGPPI